MQRDYLSYPGSSPKDNWVKVIDDAYELQLGQNLPSSSFRWNIHRDEINMRGDLCVQVMSADPSKTRLPPLVTEATGIVYLEMPLRFTPHLLVTDVPSSVRTLVFTGPGRFQFPPGLCLQTVERVIVAYGELLFDRENFPTLTDLHLKLDRKGIMLKKLPSFEELKVLGLHPCSSPLFSILTKLRLRFVCLNNSKEESIEGIERLETLTDIWLQHWDRLTDLSPLGKLPVLEDLTLTYCKRITNADALLKIPSLRRLFVWQCKNKAIEALVPDLSTLNLEELSVS